MTSRPLIVLLLASMSPAGTAAEAQQPEERGAAADTAAIAPRYELDPLVVQVTRSRQELARVPQAVTLLEAGDIQFAQRQVSVEESLRSIPGIFVASRHNPGEGVRLSVRAPFPPFGTRGLQVVQDGVPLTMADGTTAEPNNITLGSAGRIEVIRGPSSVLYGNSAGGVVSVETELPAAGPFTAHPELQFGSYGYNRQQLKATGTQAGVGYVLNLSRMEIAGFRARSEAEVRQANLVGRALLGQRTVLRGTFNLYDMPFGGNSSTLGIAAARENPTSVRALAVNHGLGKTVTQGQGGVALEHAPRGGHILRAFGWLMWRDNLIAVPFRVNDIARRGGGVRSEYQGRAELGALPLTWTTGFDVSYQKDERREYGNLGVAGLSQEERKGPLQMDQLEEVLSLGPFLQASASLSPAWTLTAGVRYDRYRFEATDRFPSEEDASGSRTLSAAGPMVGVTYAPAPSLNLYANFATAYQTPTTVELSNRPDGLRGFNQELDPEFRRSFELGARGRLEAWRLRYEVAGYMATIDRALVRFEDADEKSIYRNAGESSRDGLEVMLEWMPLPRWETRLAYTYQDFSFVRFESDDADFSGNREPGAPPHSLFTSVTYEASFGLRSGIDFRWVDAYHVNDANTASNWSYKVMDFRLGMDRTWRGLSLRPFVGVDNLLDERYNASTMLNANGGNYYEPAPDRTVYAGFMVSAGR